MKNLYSYFNTEIVLRYSINDDHDLVVVADADSELPTFYTQCTDGDRELSHSMECSIMDALTYAVPSMTMLEAVEKSAEIMDKLKTDLAKAVSDVEDENAKEYRSSFEGQMESLEEQEMRRAS